MAKKGIKNNVNTHFFWCWRGENGKEMGLRATKIRPFTFFFVTGADWHSFCTFALLLSYFRKKHEGNSCKDEILTRIQFKARIKIQSTKEI